MGGVRYRAQGVKWRTFCLPKLPTATANADFLERPAVSVILQTIHILPGLNRPGTRVSNPFTSFALLCGWVCRSRLGVCAPK